MDELLSDAFKKRAVAMGLLSKQSWPVKIGDTNFNGFWIGDEKF